MAGGKIRFTVSRRQMKEVDGYWTLEGCVGMARGVGGSERRFLLGLCTAAGKALRL